MTQYICLISHSHVSESFNVPTTGLYKTIPRTDMEITIVIYCLSFLKAQQ